jgi:hypothetical protein
VSRPATATTASNQRGTLALEDALDLEQAVRNGAQSLSDLGCEESLDARRAMAVGDLARTQLALDLNQDGDDLQSGTGGRGVRIYAHLDPDSPHATLDNPPATTSSSNTTELARA